MSEWNTIYDSHDKIIGTFRHGVAWRKEPRERLGVYDDEFVYTTDYEVIAKIAGNSVIDIIGNVVGEINDNKLYIEGKQVGKFIGSKSAGAAALVLLFRKKHNDAL